MRTRYEVEKAAHQFSTQERWSQWLRCGVHNWRALPKTDSGEHYCTECCTLWTPEGAVINEPERPSA